MSIVEDAMEKKQAIESKDAEPERDSKPKDRNTSGVDGTNKTPRKRRKVNHGKLHSSSPGFGMIRIS